MILSAPVSFSSYDREKMGLVIKGLQRRLVGVVHVD